MQSEIQNKAIVSKAILSGVIFVAIFYVLLAAALFLGSKDGSVVGFFEYMFTGFKNVENISPQTRQAAVLVANIVLVFVSFLGLNSYTLIGPNFAYTDINTGLIFFNGKKITRKFAGVIQILLAIVFYIPMVTTSILVEKRPTYLYDQISNVTSMMDFLFYLILVVAAFTNRFTRKVKVDKVKSWVFFVSAIYGMITLTILCGFSFYNYFTTDVVLTVIFAVMIIIICGLFVINEILLTKIKINCQNVQLSKAKTNKPSKIYKE
jgi:APA family basic amino acid/polyamine antiporter